VKTANLTPWCNLFSTASKYNICVKKSRYRALLYAGSALAFVLLPLVFFTYAYHLALAMTVIFFVLLGLLLVDRRSSSVIVSMFELDSHGLCSFDGIEYYQLQASSRFSFLGCWLTLQPMTAQPITAVGSMFNAKNNNSKTRFFIYRDSLSQQDFSRISRVITQLNSQLNSQS